MREVAKKTGLSREGLYKILSDKGNPEIATILRVLQVLGVELVAQSAKTKRRARSVEEGGVSPSSTLRSIRRILVS